MAYTDKNARPGSDAIWNDMLGMWMSPSGNPFGEGSSFRYDEATNRASGIPSTDDEWDIATRSRYDQGEFYDPANATGGYLDGVGITLGEGTSQTAASRDAALAAARASGVPDAWAQDFLARNPGDEQRLVSAYNGEQGGGGAAGGATAQYSGTGGGQGDAGLASLLEQLQADRASQAAERASLREILMGQLGTLQEPVSRDAAGIREVLSANRNALQRGTERSRQEIAERRAYDGSGGIGSKAYQTDVDRLLQQQGEAGAQFEGGVLFQEMQQRRSQLQSLLMQAMALGDAESARNIQAQLAALQSQMDDSYRYDALGANIGIQTAGLNNAALIALLNAA